MPSRTAWVGSTLGVLGVLGVLLLAGLLGSDDASAHRRPAQVVAPRVSTTQVCDGVLVVGFDTTRLSGQDWQPLLDDGTARLELLEVSGRSGPGGVWMPVTTASGGEHVLRWTGWPWAASHGLHFEQARIVSDGYRSVPAPIEQRCAA